jgi:polysaccharide biosynthesis protein PelC
MPKGGIGLRWAVALLLAGAGCAGSGGAFVHPDVDFSHIQRCAVLPFQNLSSDNFAGMRVQSIFLMEVLANGSLAIVEPEETASAMKDLKIPAGGVPTAEQLVALGKALSVQGVFAGSVEDYGPLNRSGQQGYQVTAAFSLFETETGNLVWRAQSHVEGLSLWKRLFGGESASLYDLSRKAARKALGSLL